MWAWLVIFVVVAVYVTTRGKQRKSKGRKRRGGFDLSDWLSNQLMKGPLLGLLFFVLVLVFVLGA